MTITFECISQKGEKVILISYLAQGDIFVLYNIFTVLFVIILVPFCSYLLILRLRKQLFCICCGKHCHNMLLKDVKSKNTKRELLPPCKTLLIEGFYWVGLWYACCNSSIVCLLWWRGKKDGSVFVPRTHHKWAVLTAAGKTPSDWEAARRLSWRRTSPWPKLQEREKHTHTRHKVKNRIIGFFLPEMSWKWFYHIYLSNINYCARRPN